MRSLDLKHQSLGLPKLSVGVAPTDFEISVPRRTHMTKLAKAILVLLFGLLLTAIPVFGQAEAGSISGTVRDASGAVVSGAKVTAKSVNTGLTRDVVTN